MGVRVEASNMAPTSQLAAVLRFHLGVYVHDMEHYTSVYQTMGIATADLWIY